MKLGLSLAKEKVQIYFSWLKHKNHLYNDLNLDTKLIDQFINESQVTSEEFEDTTKDNDSNISFAVQKQKEGNKLGLSCAKLSSSWGELSLLYL